MADPTPDPFSLADRAVASLIEHVGGAVTAERTADATAGLLERLCARLGGLVGDSGIAAVLDRARKEHAASLAAAAPAARGKVEPASAGSTSPTAFAVGTVRPWAEQVEQVRDQLRALEAAAALPAAGDLIATFIGKVCTFIGEPLAVRLLGDPWPARRPGDQEGT